MIRIHALLATTLALMLASVCLSVQAAAADPISKATPAKLSKPKHRLTVPRQNEPLGSVQRAIELDPAWHVEGVTLSQDGDTAFLVVRQIPGDGDGSVPTAPSPKDQKVSIRQIDLESGRVVGVYELPVPLAFKPLMQEKVSPVSQSMRARLSDSGHQAPESKYIRLPISQLAVSPDGQSLIASIKPPHTALIQEHGLDPKHDKSTYFLRWDTQTQTRTHVQILDDAGNCQWRMLREKGRMLLYMAKSKGWSIESWDTKDLSRTVHAEQTFGITISNPSDMNQVNQKIAELMANPLPSVPIPDCIEVDEDSGHLSAVFNWMPPNSLGGRRLTIYYWLKHYDMRTQQPTGRGTKFKSDGSLMPVMVRGEYLLLRESSTRRSSSKLIFHIWNTRQSRHFAAINASAQRSSSKAALSDGGTSFILGEQRLDLQTLEWHRAWPAKSYSQHTATTSDGRRKISVSYPTPDDTDTAPILMIYDIE
jgi:hypothetical protein